jgi:regulator of chromosome condensation
VNESLCPSQLLNEVDGKTTEHPTTLNRAPTHRLDVYVFGTNSYGELGLGDATKKSGIPTPVLNPKLSAESVGVVHVAVGGVHSAALTYDNKILTWGVNDEGTLGRDTQEEKKKVEENGFEDEGYDYDRGYTDDDEEEDEVDLNLKEATPSSVDPSYFPDGTVFTQLSATDSATFALTQEGLVYGWGTFRVCFYCFANTCLSIFGLSVTREITV